MQIEISRYYMQRIEEFAEACLESNVSQYAKRKQLNKGKIYNDIVTGKMGEFGVYLYLKSLGLSKVTKPDLVVYGAKQKSYAPDLVAYKKDKKASIVDRETIYSHRQFNIHCKTQSEDSAKRYGYSWILQYGGRGAGNRDDLFSIPTKDDYMALSYREGNTIHILGFYNFIDLCKKRLIKDPVLDYLKGIKKSIYFRDIETVHGSEFKELK